MALSRQRLQPGVLLSASVVLVACSVVYDPAAPRQCETNADCQAVEELRGRVCDADYGICVSAATAEVAGCASTTICTRQNGNQASLCRAVGQPCTPLETQDCSIVGDWRDPDAVIIGTIGPVTQAVFGGRVASMPYVPRLLDVLNLGLEEWVQYTPAGLGTFQRPLAMLHCNSNADTLRAKRIMSHLIENVQSPLVMAVGDIDLTAVANLAVEANTPLMCVACYAGAPEIELEQPLAWRVQPALEDQAALATWRVSDIERQLRAEGMLPPDAALRVALFSQNYPGINEFTDRVRSLLRFNGNLDVASNTSSFFEIQTADPRATQISQIDTARAIVDFIPHVIVVAVDTDFTTYYLRMIEDAWPAGARRPYYVATSMNQEQALLAPIIGADDDLRRRISGTGLAPDPDVSSNLEGFASRFRRRHLVEYDNTQYGYDAFYAAAYAVALADREGVSGATVMRALGSLSQGATVNIGPDAIASALIYIMEQQSIDLVGTSSRLDWDPRVGEASSDVGLWCLGRTADGALVINPRAGVSWLEATGEVLGEYACP